MSCRICKRGACSESFHSFAEQEAFEAERDEAVSLVDDLLDDLAARDAEVAKLKACVRAADALRTLVRWNGHEWVLVRPCGQIASDYDAARAEVEV